MRQTVEALITKDDEAIRSYARLADRSSVDELFADLWQNIRASKLCGGQPRSQTSSEGVVLARVAVNVAECSEDDRLKAEAWSMMAYTLNANENYAECLEFYGKCIDSFERIG